MVEKFVCIESVVLLHARAARTQRYHETNRFGNLHPCKENSYFGFFFSISTFCLYLLQLIFSALCSQPTLFYSNSNFTHIYCLLFTKSLSSFGALLLSIASSLFRIYTLFEWRHGLISRKASLTMKVPLWIIKLLFVNSTKPIHFSCPLNYPFF